MFTNISILYVDALQHKRYCMLTLCSNIQYCMLPNCRNKSFYPCQQRLSLFDYTLFNYKMFFKKKRYGPSDGPTNCDNNAKKHRSTGDRELFGLQSPPGRPLASRRNVSPEDEILQSEIEDEGSIILDFKALSASVESLACGKCGIINYFQLRKLQGSQHVLTLPAKTATIRSQPYQKNGYPHLVTRRQYKKTFR
jgi:hypothetical protein